MNILSIQSHVAYGHVGNAAAVFVLQRLGIEVWPIHTVQLSNHTAHETVRGRAFDAAHIRELVQGLAERGALAKCDAVLSGYIGSAEIGEAIVDAVKQVKQSNPKALYCCDPVIGDVGRGAFVKPEVADFIRLAAVPAADIVTPNHFELEQLVARTVRTRLDARSAVDAVRGFGPKVVLVTSLATVDVPASSIDLIVADATAHYHVRTPRLSVASHGAGDATAALFLANYLCLGSAAEALSRSASSIFGVLKHTASLGAEEMALVEAQDELVNPSATFRAEPI